MAKSIGVNRRFSHRHSGGCIGSLLRVEQAQNLSFARHLDVAHFGDIVRPPSFSDAEEFQLVTTRAHGLSGRHAYVLFGLVAHHKRDARSEEHTSELQSLMRISYAVS